MMKKLIAVVTVAFIFMLGFGQASFAATGKVTSGKMYDAFAKKYKDEHYDYQKGSLVLTDVQSMTLDKPVEVGSGDNKTKVTKIKIGMAHFKTTRDYIFSKKWDEYAIYAPEAPDNAKILSEGLVMEIQPAQKYLSTHKSKITMDSMMISLVLLIMFVIPGIFIFIWYRFKYSTMKYKLNHNLVDDDDHR